MNRAELLEKFYNTFGYLPDESELLEFETSLEEDDYSEQQRYKTVSTPPRARSDHNEYNRYRTTLSPEDELIKELKEVFRDISSKARESIRNKQDKLIDDERIDEFSYMMMSFLLRSALYFVSKGSFQKGYRFTDLY